MKKLRKHPKFDGIFISEQEKRIYTKNLDIGSTIYGERIVYENEIEYREWNPFRSKLGALISKNVRNLYLKPNISCLYLGASSGTTVSHVSDIVEQGVIYAVEFAPRSIRELIQNCRNRYNVIPIMGDANIPSEYSKYLFGDVDLIYMDVAQPNQAEIAVINSKKFLRDGGILIIAIKARSINVNLNPKEVFSIVLEKFQDNGFEILEKLDIMPYTRDHLMVTARFFEN